MTQEMSNTKVTLFGEFVTLVAATAVAVTAAGPGTDAASEHVVLELRTLAAVQPGEVSRDWPREDDRVVSLLNWSPPVTGAMVEAPPIRDLVDPELAGRSGLPPVVSFLWSWTYDAAVHGVGRWVRLDGSQRVGDGGLGAVFAVYRPPIVWPLGADG